MNTESVFQILFSNLSVGLTSQNVTLLKSNLISEGIKTIVIDMTILDMEYINRCICWHLLYR